MRKYVPLFLAVYILTVSVAFSGSCSADDVIRINGSGSAIDMLKPLVEAYRKSNRGVSIEMERPLGSSGAVKALLAGMLDVVASSRPLKSEEIEKGGRQKEYGRTPLLLATEKSVRKSNISTKELEHIYAGKTSRWPDGEAIRLVLRPREDIDTQILRSLTPGMNNAVATALTQQGMIVAVTDPEAYTAIRKTPGGMGTTTLISVTTAKLPLNILSLNGVKPTLKNMAAGKYPLYKDVSFITTARTSASALKFINFVYSPQGRSIAAKSGVLVTVGEK